MITYVRHQDILRTDCAVLAHGVAERNIEDMGTGLALQIRRMWPDSFARFKRFRRRGFWGGEVFIDMGNSPRVAYLATQPNLMYADLTLINRSARELVRQMREKDLRSCAVPKIGCGYGKLEWTEVQPVLERHFSVDDLHFKIYL